jgi:hypothetical protein
MVESVVPEGRVSVDTSSGSELGTQFRASLRVDQILKGELRTRVVAIAFSLPDAPIGFRGVSVGQYGLFFLLPKDDAWRFVDPIHPSLPAVANVQLPSASALDQVTAVLGEVLTTKQVPAEPMEALDALVQLHTIAAQRTLHDALEGTSGSLQLRIAATLVAHNDITGLEYVEAALLHPSSLSDPSSADLARCLSGLKDPAAVPSLARLVQINDPLVNRYAAAALRQSGSAAAIAPLGHLLNDADLQTRYYAVIGLAEITRENEWGPTFDEFRDHEDHYLSYWRNWAKSNVR